MSRLCMVVAAALLIGCSGGNDKSFEGKRKCAIKSYGKITCSGNAKDLKLAHSHYAPGTDYTFSSGSLQFQNASGGSVGSAINGTTSDQAAWTTLSFPDTQVPAGAKQAKVTAFKNKIGGGTSKICITIKVT